MDKIKRTIEAALFMAPSFISCEEIAKIASSTVPEVRVALNELMHDYGEKNTAITIEETDAGFTMKVKSEYEAAVGHMANLPQFNRSVMKTLAYIAYKQPVKQSDVIKFRNTKAYEHIALLKEKGIIKKERTGPTFILHTTKKFYQLFGNIKEKKGLFSQEEKPVSENVLNKEELRKDLGIEENSEKFE